MALEGSQIQKKSRRQRARTSVKSQAVELLAYNLWERHGHHHGHDVSDWLEAENMLRERARLKKSEEKTAES